ncbi:hypothetical protein [Microbacterium sp. A84]|uniref:hypothetical protein n=1 Tax=Microbacterium sp. A84 TaxID=3450715 RepID=UPI003F42FCA3
MAGFAEKDAVRQVGSSVVSFPPANVMHFDHFGWERTHGAPTVTFDERKSLCSSE